jgi:TonB family protein
MMTSLLKRALPFVLTLIAGTGLGSIFGFNSSTPNTSRTSSVTVTSERRYSCSSQRRRAFQSDSTPLKITFQPNTRYTPEALKHKTTGVVQLRVRFNADGTTTVVERISTLPDGLTEEAERVVEQTQFTPATINGEPVSQTKEMNYIFSLSDRVTMGL